MKKSLKTFIIILAVIVVIGLCVGGYFIWRHNNMYIGQDAAIDIALEDAGLSRSMVYDISAEFEKSHGHAWYDVDFQNHSLEYDYVIDAVNGSILSSSAQPDD